MGGGLTIPPDLLAEWATNREKFPYGERRKPYLIILISILFALTIVVVAARLWARCKIRRNAGLDDFLIVAALVSSSSTIYLTALLTELAFPYRLRRLSNFGYAT